MNAFTLSWQEILMIRLLHKHQVILQVLQNALLLALVGASHLRRDSMHIHWKSCQTTINRVVLLAGIFTCQSIQAEEVAVAGRTLKLNPPHGFCLVDKTTKQERDLLKKEGANNAEKVRMLQLSVECSELAEFRAGTREYLHQWAKVVVLKTDGKVESVPFTRPQFAAMLAKSANRTQRSDPQAMNLMLEDAFRETGFIASDRNVQIIGADLEAAYLNMSVQLRVTPNRTRDLRGVGAMSVANGLPIAVYLFRVIGEKNSPNKEAPTLQKYLQAVLAAN